MTGNSLLLACIGHLVGDYIVQNDWMALNKKRDPFICAIHCGLWTVSVLAFSGWMFLSTWWLVGGILFVTHFAQDHTDIVRRWMRLIGQEQFATGVCAPWSIIVVDNVWHILTIWGLWLWLI